MTTDLSPASSGAMPGSKLRAALGIPDRYIAREVEIPSHPGHPIGMRPLTDLEVAHAHAAAIRWCRTQGFIGRGVSEDEASHLADLLGTKRGAKAAEEHLSASGMAGIVSASEVSHAISAEYLAVALCDPTTNEPLVRSATELRSVLERGDIEYLSEVLEEWQLDRAPRRVHLSRKEITEIAEAAKKGQPPTTTWSNCAYSTLVDCATIMASILGQCGGATSSSTTCATEPQQSGSVVASPAATRLVP